MVKSVSQWTGRGAAALSLSLASLTGCAAEVPEEAQGRGLVSAPMDQHAAILDIIDLGEGASVTLEDGPNGGLIVSGDGPVSQKSTLDAVMAASGVREMYEMANARIPDAVELKLAAEGADVLMPVGELMLPSSDEIDPEGLEDALGDDLKGESPRNVSWFRDTQCEGDMMDENQIYQGWWRRLNTCSTERTNDFQYSLYAVRQGYFAAHMYRGNATMQYWWQNGSTWVHHTSWSVNQGYYKTMRVTLGGAYNIRFKLVNASGDGYNYAIHSADSDLSAMKGTESGPTDIYATICSYTQPGSSTTRYVTYTSCLPTSTETWRAAAEICDGATQPGKPLFGMSSVRTLNWERQTTDGRCLQRPLVPVPY